MKPIQINVSKEKFALAYISLLRGGVKDGLTNSEVLVLEQLLLKYMELKKQGLTEEWINRILFDTETKKVMRATLAYSYHNFQNYINSLKAKGLILFREEKYSLNPFIIPVENVTFEFILK